MSVGWWRHESPEEARRRRRCRKMLGLPPEIVYHHVPHGLATLGAVTLVLTGAIAWQLDHFATVAPLLTSVPVVVALTVAVFQARRRYRHVLAAGLVVAAMLGALVATAHRYGSIGSVALLAGATPSALANSNAAAR